MTLSQGIFLQVGYLARGGVIKPDKLLVKERSFLIEGPRECAAQTPLEERPRHILWADNLPTKLCREERPFWHITDTSAGFIYAFKKVSYDDSSFLEK